MHDLPDESLVALAAAGRQDAFGILVRRHQRRVAGLAFRFCGRRTDAEDIAQDVFLTAWNWAPRWRPEAKFSTWLYRVTVNACLNLQRRSRPDLVDGLDSRAGLAEEPSRGLERREQESAVAAAVQSLPPNQRIALLLKRFEEKSHKEIAEAMEITVPAVEGLLQRAYDGLREKLRAGFSPAAC